MIILILIVCIYTSSLLAKSENVYEAKYLADGPMTHIFVMEKVFLPFRVVDLSVSFFPSVIYWHNAIPNTSIQKHYKHKK